MKPYGLSWCIEWGFRDLGDHRDQALKSQDGYDYHRGKTRRKRKKRIRRLIKKKERRQNKVTHTETL